MEGSTRAFQFDTQPGQGYDAARVQSDVRRLWATGAFDDVVVEANGGAGNVDLVFRVVEKRRTYLHDIKIEPRAGRDMPKAPPGTLIDPAGAQRAATRAVSQLVQDGYRDASVSPELVPAGANSVDLLLHENAGTRFVVRQVRFEGNLGVLTDADLGRSLDAMSAHRVLPLVWTRHAPFSTGAVQNDIARLRSLYISRGYLEPDISMGGVQYSGNRATVTLSIAAGTRYRLGPAEIRSDGRAYRVPAARDGSLPASLCACMLRERLSAERAGKMDFDSRMQISPSGAATVTIDTGEPYTVGRIDIRGNHRYGDSTIRRALLLSEGDLFDWDKLRRSMRRVDDMGLFNPVDDDAIRLNPEKAQRRADIVFTVSEKPRGRWFLSGPVGPASFAGPLQATIQSRLPAWGRGILEASTYFLTFSYVGFASPIFKFMPQKRFYPLIALERPLLPGQWFTSGFLLSPQLGWPGIVESFTVDHAYATARHALAAGTDAPMSIPVTRVEPGGKSRDEGYLICERGQSRFRFLRNGTRVLLDFAFASTRPGI